MYQPQASQNRFKENNENSIFFIRQMELEKAASAQLCNGLLLQGTLIHFCKDSADRKIYYKS